MKVFVVRLLTTTMITRFYFMNEDTGALLACAQHMLEGDVDGPVHVDADGSVYTDDVVLRGNLLVINAVMDFAGEDINDDDFLAGAATQHTIFDLPHIGGGDQLLPLSFDDMGDLLLALHVVRDDLRALVASIRAEDEQSDTTH